MGQVGHYRNGQKNGRGGGRGAGADPTLSRVARDVARDAVEEMEAGRVGAHLGAHRLAEAGDGHVAVHRFAADVPGYSGWEWQAVVACAAGSTYVTVNEVSLVPSQSGDALQAPEWVPWAERVRPGDLEPGTVMPPELGDPRLTEDPSRSATRASDASRGRAARGRRYWLSREGLAGATARWRAGDFGPDGDFAREAHLHCRTCAFYVPCGEPLENFGACTNEFAADGRLVHAAAGCGAHSETPPAGGDHTAGMPAFDDERPVY